MRTIAILALALAAGVLVSGKLHAHDSWISRGAHQNAAGEWCCGDGDCGRMIAGRVVASARGYDVAADFAIEHGDGRIEIDRVREFVPYAEAQPSPDGAYWRCKRPDGSRRCFFAPPPNS